MSIFWFNLFSSTIFLNRQGLCYLPTSCSAAVPGTDRPHLQGRCWSAVLALLQPSLPVLQCHGFFSWLCWESSSLLHCKSSSAEKTARSQAILVSLMISVKKGSPCCCVSFGLSPMKHFLSQKTKLQLSFDSENQAQAYILQLIGSYSGWKNM